MPRGRRRKSPTPTPSSSSSEEEEEEDPRALDDAISELTRVVHSEGATRSQALHFLRVIYKHGDHYGFTSKQAARVVRLAMESDIRLRARKGTSRQGAGIEMVACIRPARDCLFDEDFVLAALSTLGGAERMSQDTESMARDSPEENEPMSDEDSEDESEDDSKDNNNTQSPELRQGASNHARKRSRASMKLQVGVMKLLLILYAPPPVHTWQRHLVTGDAEIPGTSGTADRGSPLPSTFYTAKARRTLDQCYGLLFHFLDFKSLRPYLIHLLCLMTRRKHVRHHRIAKILRLRALSPIDFYTSALVDTYAAFYPDLLFVFSSAAVDRPQYAAQAHGLRYPGILWLQTLQKIWSGTTRPGEFQIRNKEGTIIPNRMVGGPATRKHLERLPTGATSSAEALVPVPNVLLPKESTLSLLEFASFRELGYRFDKAQMPDQLASALAHRMTAVAILATEAGTATAETLARISEWTMSCLSDELSLPLLIQQGSLLDPRKDSASAPAVPLIFMLAEVVERIGCCDKRLQLRFARILHLNVWQQLRPDERDAVLGFIELFLPLEAEMLASKILAPLDAIAEAEGTTDNAAAAVVQCYAKLLYRWTTHDWPALYQRLESGEPASIGPVILSRKVDYAGAVAVTIRHATELVDRLLTVRPHSVALIHTALALHEIIFSESLIGLHDETFPQSLVLYLPGFTQRGAIMTLSRQFGLVQKVRLLHQDYLSAKADGVAVDDVYIDGRPVPRALKERRKSFFTEAYSDRINDCVILLVDLVWRNNGFSTVQEDGSIELGLSASFFSALTERCQGRGDELERIGSASHSAMLGILMEAYANDLARKRGASNPVLHGPVTPRKLKDARQHNFPAITNRDFRDSFLTWLAHLGAHGISDLLNVTITRFIRGQEFDQSTVLG